MPEPSLRLGSSTQQMPASVLSTDQQTAMRSGSPTVGAPFSGSGLSAQVGQGGSQQMVSALESRAAQVALMKLIEGVYERLDDYLKAPKRLRRYEQGLTATITTSTLVSAPVYRGTLQVTFSRTFGAAPQVCVSGQDIGNPCWAGVKSVSASAATVQLFSAANGGTGRVLWWAIGK